MLRSNKMFWSNKMCWEVAVVYLRLCIKSRQFCLVQLIVCRDGQHPCLAHKREHQVGVKRIHTAGFEAPDAPDACCDPRTVNQLDVSITVLLRWDQLCCTCMLRSSPWEWQECPPSSSTVACSMTPMPLRTMRSEPALSKPEHVTTCRRNVRKHWETAPANVPL